MRTGRGFRPIYVGKAVKQTFGKECFAPHKTGEHYNPALLDTLKGTPVIFFVALPHIEESQMQSASPILNRS